MEIRQATLKFTFFAFVFLKVTEGVSVCDANVEIHIKMRRGLSKKKLDLLN